MKNVAIFKVSNRLSPYKKIDEFIKWASPQGDAGINHIHKIPYDLSAPYFEWSTHFLAQEDSITRSWFLKYEYLDNRKYIFGRKTEDPNIWNRDGLIAEGRFLEFAKAYINIIVYYRGIRSPPKKMILAIICLEKSLRSLYKNNLPELMSAKAFEKALILIGETKYGVSVQYEIGRELEILAGMIQGGLHKNKSGYMKNGFNLLETPFSFNSNLKDLPRRQAIKLNTTDLENHPKRISIEEVCAVGLAYRKSMNEYGRSDYRTFMSAIAGLAFSTVSMRVSDLLTLQRDAIYVQDDQQRHRIRISRPKIDTSQNLPISRQLGGLASELFHVLLDFTEESSNAFQFYIENSPENFNSISEIYIPKSLREIFNKEFISIIDVYKIPGITCEPPYTVRIPQRMHGIDYYDFVENPCDIWIDSDTFEIKSWQKLARYEIVLAHCKKIGIETFFPKDIGKDKYLRATAVRRYTQGTRSKIKFLMENIFADGKQAQRHIRSEDLKKWLLEDFKTIGRFPHWPYTSKDRITRLDKALLVCPALNSHKNYFTGKAQSEWWLPTAMTGPLINVWLSGGTRPPVLFENLNIKLADSSYPSVTLHDTRKYHHTEALLAGAHETFIDELAGRRSGKQSDHYDLRSPKEIVIRSIETFDPDEDFTVIGPVAKESKKIKVTERTAFLYQTAAPKHITDIGGCATDWSLDPCKQYGDCMRCDQHVWRKGDSKRLSQITLRQSYATKMIAVAKEKIIQYEVAPRALLLQLRQFEDDLSRCNSIFAIEADKTIAVGAIVTFQQSEGVMTASELTTHLINASKQNIQKEN